MSVLFAATYPERTTALVLYGAFAKRLWSAGLSVGADSRTTVSARSRDARANWGEPHGSRPARAERGRRVQAIAWRRTFGAARARARRCALMRMNTQTRRARRAADDPGADAGHAPDATTGTSASRRAAGSPTQHPRRAVRRAPGRRTYPLGRRHRRDRRRGRGVPDRRPARAGARPRARDRAVHRHRRLDRAARRSSATGAGASCSSGTTRSCGSELERFRGREVDTAGDGFLATFDGPARAIRCARGDRRPASATLGLEVRAGLHTGECELVGDTVAGIAVHTGARVASAGRRRRGARLAAPSRTSSPARASSSRSAARTS